jgi:hypothetical protein
MRLIGLPDRSEHCFGELFSVRDLGDGSWVVVYKERSVGMDGDVKVRIAGCQHSRGVMLPLKTMTVVYAVL